MISSARTIGTDEPAAVFKIRTSVCWFVPGPGTTAAATTVAPGNHLASSGEMLSKGDGVCDQEIFTDGDDFFVDWNVRGTAVETKGCPAADAFCDVAAGRAEAGIPPGLPPFAKPGAPA